MSKLTPEIRAARQLHELREKIDELQKLIHGTGFKYFDKDKRDALIEEMHSMCAYRSALIKRMKVWGISEHLEPADIPA